MNSSRLWTDVLLLLLLATLSLPGCGRRGNTPIAGLVTLENGAPLVNATVTFHGEDQKSYVVKTDADGRYIAMTDSQTQGLPPGKYAVTVHEALGDDIDARPVPNIHPKYTYSDSTDLSLVVADQPLETDFTLAPPKR